MATRKEIRQAYSEASLALKKLMSLVEQGLPAEMVDDEDEYTFYEVYDIATILFPLYMEDEYMEIEMYAEGMTNRVDR